MAVKVLFLCEDHAIKRKMAAQIAANMNQSTAVQVYQYQSSFDATDNLMRQALDEVEINPAIHTVYEAKDLTREVYDVIIILCTCFRTKTLVFPGFPHVLYWPMPNPVRKGCSPAKLMDYIREVRDELMNRIRHFFQDGYLSAFVRHARLSSDLFEDNSVGVVQFSRDEMILSVNSRCSRVTGYTKESLCGRSLRQLFPDESISRYISAVLVEGVGYRECDLKLRDASGQLMKVRATVKPFAHSQGLMGVIDFDEANEDEILQPMDGCRGLERLTWERVEASLKQVSGNRTKAAKLLGVGRATFYRYLDKLKDEGRDVDQLIGVCLINQENMVDYFSHNAKKSICS